MSNPNPKEIDKAFKLLLKKPRHSRGRIVYVPGPVKVTVLEDGSIIVHEQED